MALEHDKAGVLVLDGKGVNDEEEGGGKGRPCVYYPLLISNYFCNPLSLPTIVPDDDDDDGDDDGTYNISFGYPTQPLRNYKVQSTGGMKQWYLLSLFIGDAVRDVPLCKHLAKRMPCPGTGPLPPPQPR